MASQGNDHISVDGGSTLKGVLCVFHGNFAVLNLLRPLRSWDTETSSGRDLNKHGFHFDPIAPIGAPMFLVSQIFVSQ